MVYYMLMDNLFKLLSKYYQIPDSYLYMSQDGEYARMVYGNYGILVVNQYLDYIKQGDYLMKDDVKYDNCTYDISKIRRYAKYEMDRLLLKNKEYLSWRDL